MNQKSPNRQVTEAVTDGWVQGGSFFGSILAGMLLGLAADYWLGTKPWLVVTGILVGSYSGFVSMWRFSRHMENGKEPLREAGRD